jgi:hypothetical protein
VLTPAPAFPSSGVADPSVYICVRSGVGLCFAIWAAVRCFSSSSVQSIVFLSIPSTVRSCCMLNTATLISGFGNSILPLRSTLLIICFFTSCTAVIKVVCVFSLYTGSLFHLFSSSLSNFSCRHIAALFLLAIKGVVFVCISMATTGVHFAAPVAIRKALVCTH